MAISSGEIADASSPCLVREGKLQIEWATERSGLASGIGVKEKHGVIDRCMGERWSSL